MERAGSLILQLYVATIIIVAVVSMAVVDWTALFALSTNALWALGLLSLLGIASEIFAVRQNRKGSPSTVSLTFLPLVASCLIFGPAAAVVFIVATEAVAELLVRRKQRVKAYFNVAQAGLATAIAGWAFIALGGEPTAAATGEINYREVLLPTAVFGLMALMVNHLAVTIALGLSQPSQVRRILRVAFSRVGSTVIYDVLVLPVALVVAVLYESIGLLGLAVAMLPLIFIRHAYSAKFRVEAANRDLLDALVTAIETRDPYTSGHAKRVQNLASKIGESLRLPPSRLDDLKAAALLHDIGKIEAKYEEVLKKPSKLSEKELLLIQSHVSRGVEILESLSSLSGRVIEGVAHHHERWDGGGYPIGLAETDISLFGRIIAVCDAVDAMLSDRPYRKALTVRTVYGELRRCAGRQFDPAITEVVTRFDLVTKHQEDIRLRKHLSQPVSYEEQPVFQMHD